VLDLSEDLREFVDRAEPPVTISDVEAVMASRPARRTIRNRRGQWRRPGVLAAAAVGVVALVVGIVALTPSPPVKVAISATTPVVLDVPSAPKLAVRLPSDAIDRYRINWAKVPSYIPLYLGSSLIGYLKKDGVEHPPLIAAPQMRISSPLPTRTCRLVAPNSPQVVDVFNRSHVLIGQIYPNSGFVRLGEGQTCN